MGHNNAGEGAYQGSRGGEGAENFDSAMCIISAFFILFLMKAKTREMISIDIADVAVSRKPTSRRTSQTEASSDMEDTCIPRRSRIKRVCIGIMTSMINCTSDGEVCRHTVTCTVVYMQSTSILHACAVPVCPDSCSSEDVA